jgi:hypothetical protein
MAQTIAVTNAKQGLSLTFQQGLPNRTLNQLETINTLFAQGNLGWTGQAVDIIQDYSSNLNVLGNIFDSFSPELQAATLSLLSQLEGSQTLGTNTLTLVRNRLLDSMDLQSHSEIADLKQSSKRTIAQWTQESPENKELAATAMHQTPKQFKRTMLRRINAWLKTFLRSAFGSKIISSSLPILASSIRHPAEYLPESLQNTKAVFWRNIEGTDHLFIPLINQTNNEVYAFVAVKFSKTLNNEEKQALSKYLTESFIHNESNLKKLSSIAKAINLNNVLYLTLSRNITNEKAFLKDIKNHFSTEKKYSFAVGKVLTTAQSGEASSKVAVARFFDALQAKVGDSISIYKIGDNFVVAGKYNTKDLKTVLSVADNPDHLGIDFTVFEGLDCHVEANLSTVLSKIKTATALTETNDEGRVRVRIDVASQAAAKRLLQTLRSQILSTPISITEAFEQIRGGKIESPRQEVDTGLKIESKTGKEEPLVLTLGALNSIVKREGKTEKVGTADRELMGPLANMGARTERIIGRLADLYTLYKEWQKSPDKKKNPITSQKHDTVIRLFEMTEEDHRESQQNQQQQQEPKAQEERSVEKTEKTVGIEIKGNGGSEIFEIDPDSPLEIHIGMTRYVIQKNKLGRIEVFNNENEIVATIPLGTAIDIDNTGITVEQIDISRLDVMNLSPEDILAVNGTISLSEKDGEISDPEIELSDEDIEIESESEVTSPTIAPPVPVDNKAYDKYSPEVRIFMNDWERFFKWSKKSLAVLRKITGNPALTPEDLTPEDRIELLDVFVWNQNENTAIIEHDGSKYRVPRKMANFLRERCKKKETLKVALAA